MWADSISHGLPNPGRQRRSLSDLGRLGSGVVRPIDGRRAGKLSHGDRPSHLRPFGQRRPIRPRHGGQNSGRRLPFSSSHRLGRNASKTYSGAVNGTTGARVTWQSAYDAAIKDFTDDQSNERADLEINLATLDAAYATLESQSYATALANLATTTPSPWADQAAAEAQAAADRVAEIATEQAAWRTTAANATRQEEIDAATAQEALSTAESTAAPA